MVSGGNQPTPDLQVVPEDVKQVGISIHETQQLLRRALDTSGHDVDALTSSGWTGDAARAFAAGWRDCYRGGVEILDALATLANTLHVAGVDYESTESANTAPFSGLNLGSRRE